MNVGRQAKTPMKRRHSFFCIIVLALLVARIAAEQVTTDTLTDLTNLDKTTRNYIISTLGISATGQISKIGHYTNIDTQHLAKPGDNLIHLVQTDSFNKRLLWSLLINQDTNTIVILYHHNQTIELNKPIQLNAQQVVQTSGDPHQH